MQAYHLLSATKMQWDSNKILRTGHILNLLTLLIYSENYIERGAINKIDKRYQA